MFMYFTKSLECALARGLTVESFWINPCSSNFPCVTPTKRIGQLEMKLPEFFRTTTLNLFLWTFFLRLIEKQYLTTIQKKISRAFQPRLTNLKFIFIYKIYAVHQQSSKVLEGLYQQYIFFKDQVFILGSTWKIAKAWKFLIFVS